MKEKIVSIGFIIILFCFSGFFIIKKDESLSNVERRKLKTKDVLKKDFVNNLEDYLSDQFPMRNSLIQLNTFFERYLLQQKDSNDVYIKEEVLIEKNYPKNQESIKNFIKKINEINAKDLQNSEVYYAIIPDKSYFLEETKHLKMDFLSIYQQLKNELNLKEIPVRDLFTLEDYYQTDIHLRQEKYPKVVERLGSVLDFDYKPSTYETNHFYPFYGASYQKAPLFRNPESITYLTNETIKKAKAKHLEYGEQPIYEIDKLNSMDAYNVFLGGPSALIEIENPEASNEKELIIFRDSFASSLTPLLISEYQKITLIDLRYISMNQIRERINFNNKEVLFLYSTLIVNNSHLLKN